MAKNRSALLGVAALGAGYLITRRGQGGDGTGGGGGEALTCEQQVQAAQEFGSGDVACNGTDVTLACPNGDVRYSPTNTCEENWLRSNGWTVVTRDTPDDPQFVEYEFRVLSDSTTGVNYTLHVGPQPEPVTSGIDSAYVAEPGDNDTITKRSDGTWVVRGRTGSATGDRAYGDTYRWTVADNIHSYGVLGWDADLASDAYTLEVDGSPLSPADLPALSL